MTQNEKNTAIDKLMIGIRSMNNKNTSKLINRLENSNDFISNSRNDITRFVARMEYLLSASKEVPYPFEVGNYYISPDQGDLFNIQLNGKSIGTISASRTIKRVSQDFNLKKTSN